jgi:hypothetical protein
MPADFAFGALILNRVAHPWKSWYELLQIRAGRRILRRNVPLGFSGWPAILPATLSPNLRNAGEG